MQYSFHKYQGTGNDFIIIDNRKESFPKNNHKLVSKICDRRFGIGADGLILIENHPKLHYKMEYINPDGTKSLCGNGSRCAFVFAQTLGLAENNATFEASDGVHTIFSNKFNMIRFQFFDFDLPKPIHAGWFIDTGSPHWVKIVENLDQIDVESLGKEIRNHPKFVKYKGTNVNFISLSKDHISIRTYERGVERETLSCGTGSVAAALVGSCKGINTPVMIHAKGGILKVHFKKYSDGFRDIFLEGPVEKVFEGLINI